ncbi:MAG: serine/threonine-protein kinase [Candidatus Melainabacteria bacterium]|nr:serine/threonine-protein kinase [Candidatus Melainabacteria bacterium]
MAFYSVHEPVDLNDGGIPPHLNSTLSGRYGVQTLLGVGRTSRVYEARVFPSGEQVAVKILREHCNTSENLERLKWEGEVLNSLVDSEYFLRPIDFAVDGNSGYLVIEKAQGHTLAKVLKDFGRLSLLDSIDVGIQIIEALNCLHQLGYVHTSLTAEDIMLQRCNNRYSVKIVDLDSTCSMTSPATKPMPMIGEGTFDYMSPEQAMNGRLDVRTDVYIFGLLFYEMLTGRRPFFGSNPVELLNARFSTKPESITAILGGIEYGIVLDDIIDRTLAPESNKRFRDLNDIDLMLSKIWKLLTGRDYVTPRKMLDAGAYDEIELNNSGQSASWMQKIASLFKK